MKKFTKKICFFRKNIALILTLSMILLVLAACDEGDKTLSLDTGSETFAPQTAADTSREDSLSSEIATSTEQATTPEATETETETEVETEMLETGLNDLVIDNLVFDESGFATVGSVKLKLSDDGTEFVAVWALPGFSDVVIPSSVNSVPVKQIGGEAFKGSSFTSIVIPKSVVFIDVCAFGSGKYLTTVYYEGTEEEWSNVNIANDYNANRALHNATKYFYSDAEPAADGNYWHYVDGVAVKWE